MPPPTEQEICDEFGVSKATARDVIRSLAERGFVDVRQGRRMQLRRASEWNQLDPLMIELIDDPGSPARYLADVHYVRTLIEPEVAARAALSANADQIARARDVGRADGDARRATPTPTSRPTSPSIASSRRRPAA